MTKASSAATRIVVRFFPLLRMGFASSPYFAVIYPREGVNTRRENGSLSIADISSMDALMMRRIPPLLAYVAAFSFSCVSFAVYTFIYNFAQNAYYPKGEICP